MITKVLGIEREGTCSLTGKKGECFVLQTEDGPQQLIATKRVLEILRWNASVGNDRRRLSGTDRVARQEGAA